eukprot:TRINITY_DN50034_c0_g1_i1.p1 TRINITY_DN50034_c0_g1~~TRINITY_DN50034_c0_g1_i1.p1  ORF type:complete len:205 (-),score=32.16 TRINITY_DN50034_c0_g1_i1:103-717(-)
MQLWMRWFGLQRHEVTVGNRRFISILLAINVLSMPVDASRASLRIRAVPASSWGSAQLLSSVPPSSALPPPGTEVLSAVGGTAASVAQVQALREEIGALREEVARGQNDMWRALKLITSTVDQDMRDMKSMTHDVALLRGRRAGQRFSGSAGVVPSKCDARQSSCGDCVACPTCVWCEVEQRCVLGDSVGPLHGDCSLFRFGKC